MDSVTDKNKNKNINTKYTKEEINKKKEELPLTVFEDLYGYRKAGNKKNSELTSFDLDYILEDDEGNNLLEYISLLHSELIGHNKTMKGIKKDLSRLANAAEKFLER